MVNVDAIERAMSEREAAMGAPSLTLSSRNACEEDHLSMTASSRISYQSVSGDLTTPRGGPAAAGVAAADAATTPQSAREQAEIDKEFDFDSPVFRAKQTAFFGRDHRSLEKRGSVAGLAFNTRSVKTKTKNSSDELSSVGVAQSSGKSLTTNSAGRGESKHGKHRRRRSSLQILGDNAKKHVRRMSVREAARAGVRHKRRKEKPCCLLRSKFLHIFLTSIFGRRFEVKHEHMHVLARNLTASQRRSTILKALAFFFLVPLLCVCALWAIPLRSLAMPTSGGTPSANINSTGLIYTTDTVPLDASEQAVYFWVTLPLVFFPLSLIPAHWYHRTMDIPIVYSASVSLVAFLAPALATAHAAASQRRMFNAMIAMGVGTCSSLLLVGTASIGYGWHRSAKGGYRAYRAAAIIQRAWNENKSGIGLEKVHNWMAASGVDDHAVVMDEVSLFKGIKPGTVARIQMAMQPREYAAGEVICKEGEPGRHFFIIIQGVVSVTMRGKGTVVREDEEEEEEEEEIEGDGEGEKDGDEENGVERGDYFGDNVAQPEAPVTGDVEICRMRGGDYFGEVALLDPSGAHTRSASVIATSSVVKVFCISGHDFQRGVLPNLSDESRDRLQRAARRRLNHTAEFKFEVSGVAGFIRRSLDVDQLPTPGSIHGPPSRHASKVNS